MTECVDWLPRERAAWTVPAEILPSEWAANYRILDEKNSKEAGPWSNERTPFLVEVMDSVTDKAMSKLTLKCCARGGKTEAINNMIAWKIDTNPGPMMVVMPRDKDIERRIEQKLKPMIDASPRLRRHKTGRKTDWRKDGLELNRCQIFGAAAGSPAGLADVTAEWQIADEVGKYKREGLGVESDTLSLLGERGEAVPQSSLLIAASSPTDSGDLISQSWDESSQEECWVPCLHCGEYQEMEFARIKFDSQEDPSRLQGPRNEDAGLAEFECKHCKQRTIDRAYNRQAMVSRGRWCPKGCKIDRDGNVVGEWDRSHRGFHWSRLITPWHTWSRVAAEFLRSLKNRVKLKNWNNSWMGLAYDEVVERTDPERLKANESPYPAGSVSPLARLITAGVDIGEHMTHYVIRAWGVGEESWLIERNRIETRWDVLHDLLFGRGFEVDDGSGDVMPIRRACIDSGYQTDRVYQFCRAIPGGQAIPIKGRDSIDSGIAYEVSPVEKARGKRRRYGLALYLLNTHFLKSKLSRLMNVERGEPGFWHLHEDSGDEYRKQMCAEHLVVERGTRTTRRVWKPRPGYPDNHYFDAENYCLAAAEVEGVYRLKPRGPQQSRRRTQPSRRREQEYPEDFPFKKRSSGSFIDG